MQWNEVKSAKLIKHYSAVIVCYAIVQMLGNLNNYTNAVTKV